VLTLRDLILFNIAAVIGIRWLAAAAHAGPGTLTLWALAAVFFFVPSALAVSALSHAFPGHGGVYLWTRESFGPWHGFLCGYCYWISNLFYFPSLAVAGVAMTLQFAGQSENRLLVGGLSLLVILAVTSANILGLGAAKWIGNLGGTATYAAMILLIATAAAVWIQQGPRSTLNLAPELDWGKVNFWPQIAFAFGGLELAAFLRNEVRGGERTVRQAAWTGGAAIAVFYMAGTLALLVILPAAGISEVTGLTQAGAEAGRMLGSPLPGLLLTVFVALGISGQLSAWMGGTARLPLAMGMDRYLPPRFAELHPRWRTPVLALILQGGACCLFLILMQLGETLRSGYQLLVDMTVITYFIPFLYMFGAAWKSGLRWSGASGLLVTLAALGFSFVPPAGTPSVLLFETKLTGGTLLLIALAWIWYKRR